MKEGETFKYITGPGLAKTVVSKDPSIPTKLVEQYPERFKKDKKEK